MVDGQGSIGCCYKMIEKLLPNNIHCWWTKNSHHNTAWGTYKNLHNGFFYGQVNILSSTTTFNEKGPFFKKYIKNPFFIFHGRVINSFYKYLIIQRCFCQSNWGFFYSKLQMIPSYLLWTLEQLYIAQTSAELACPFLLVSVLSILSQQMDWPL